jgi:LysM repeat protein
MNARPETRKDPEMNGSRQPQYSPPEHGEARRRVKIAIFSLLGVHAAFLMALLLQGCRQDPAGAQAESSNTNSTPSIQVTNPFVAQATNPPAASSNTPPETASTNASPHIAATNAPTVASFAGTDYTITASDTFAKMARSLHVTVKAITEANPGIEPTKLQIGQRVHIPAVKSPTALTDLESRSNAQTNGARLYTVRSGDYLVKIAAQFGTTVSAIREPAIASDLVVGDEIRGSARKSTEGRIEAVRIYVFKPVK